MDHAGPGLLQTGSISFAGKTVPRHFERTGSVLVHAAFAQTAQMLGHFSRLVLAHLVP
jgi:hypothetical protein